MRARETMAATAVLALGAAVVVEAWTLPFGGLHAPGPGFFPRCLGGLLIFLGAVLLGQALRASPGPARARGRLAKVFALLAALVVYVAVLDAAGYAIATFLLVLFMVRVLEPQRWLVALSVAVLASAGSYVLFASWLSVPLPPGPFGR